MNHDAEFDGAIEIDTRTGLIERIGPREGRSDIEVGECLIFPGFGDIHIHAREDADGTQKYKEDFVTASDAAIHGGVVHVADMPNNPVAPIDDGSYMTKEALTEASVVHVTLYAGIGPQTNPLKRHVPYKAFMGPSVGDLFFTSQAELESSIAKYRGKNVSFHCEDPEILERNKSASTHELRRPASAEISATEFALYLIEKHGLVGKLCHYSTREGLQKIIAARSRGVRVTCEVTPHHLFFDESMITEENRLWLQMNPPLRSAEDRLALIAALKNGDIDYIATDHAPHTIAEKGKGASGVPLLDTYGAFVTWLMTEQGCSAADIARVCAFNPGKFVREFLPVDCGKGYGRVEAGYVGSLTILDLNKPYFVSRESIKSKCGWSPFEGYTFPGSVRYTIVRGEVYPAA